ncbi:MAG: hypothetical protein VB064_12930 [Oscillospiraceae bacterium]|nr:hypothetical protein [Oscillospiraceae bacterium]
MNIEEIKARAEAATKGKWQAIRSDDGNTSIFTIVGRYIKLGDFENKTDADFIANAREDIPALVAEVERISANETKLINDMEEYKHKYHVALNELATAKAERDAAVEDIPHYCGMCANHCTEEEATQKCGEGWEGEGCDDWQWRGVRKDGE